MKSLRSNWFKLVQILLLALVVHCCSVVHMTAYSISHLSQLTFLMKRSHNICLVADWPAENESRRSTNRRLKDVNHGCIKEHTCFSESTETTCIAYNPRSRYRSRRRSDRLDSTVRIFTCPLAHRIA